MPVNCYNSQCPYNDNDFEVCRKDISVDECEEAFLSIDGYTRSKAFFIKAHRSPACQCGLEKNRGQLLCSKCFNSLPGDLQSRLYINKKPTKDNKKAYEVALKWLEV